MDGMHDNLWAPWRMEYIGTLQLEPKDACFLCRYAGAAAQDTQNYVVWRTPLSLVVLNRFPYNNGHVLIAPLAHKASLSELTQAESLDSLRLMRFVMDGLRERLHAQGFNVGMNVGHCAGAGLPDHLHWHVVPRWSGDTNYMTVLSDVRVIPESLARNMATLRDWAQENGLTGQFLQAPDGGEAAE